MLTETILKFSNPEKIISYYIGRKLKKNFELPDNILVFKHDFFFDEQLIHGRHVLLFPAVPLRCRMGKNVKDIDVQPDQCAYFYPYQFHCLVKTYPDIEHGYPRLFITFELTQKQNYLPKSTSLNITPQVEKIVAEILSAYTNRENTELSVWLYLLLNELSRNPENKLIEQPSDKVQTILSYIHRHLERQFGLKELCEFTKISVTNMQLHFKREMGCTIGDYIINQRIALAKIYLQKDELSVEEIALRCGFQSIYAFSHFFKKHENVSPLNWKKYREDSSSVS